MATRPLSREREEFPTRRNTSREASLLVEHAGIASYFAEIFEADWNMSEPGEAVFGIGAESNVEASAFAEGGVVSSSVRDYVDV